MILTKLVRVMIERLYRGLIDRIGGDAIITLQTRKSPRQKFNASLPDIPASLDYLVHWTISDLSGMADAQAEVLKGIEDCIDLAPLHNPTTSREFSWRGTDSVLPGVAHRPRYSPLHLFRPCGAGIESRGRVESKRMIAARFLRSCRYSIWLAFALQKGQSLATHPTWPDRDMLSLHHLGFYCKRAGEKETTVEQQGLATQTVKVETGEVMYVAGNDLVVKTDEGELRHFPNVPDDKTVTVAGKELTVHEPGMKLQRTTITPTTPQMITTVKTVTGKVWHVNPPNSVILTLEDGTNQSFNIPKGQKFSVDRQETDTWGLKEGMKISATAVTETPETVVSQEVVRTGTVPSSTPQLPRQGAILFIIVAPSKLP